MLDGRQGLLTYPWIATYLLYLWIGALLSVAL